jgi:two-component system, NtrC family, response regulator HydG
MLGYAPEGGSMALSVVIIDDNPRSLELLSTALAHDGLAVYTASTPEAGLELVYTHRPQLVLTDLKMPGMDGLEVLEQVLRFNPTIDVVIMTAHYTVETAVEAIRKGAADYLSKPLKLNVLRERVGRLVESARQKDAVSAGGGAGSSTEFRGMVSRSPKMWEVFTRILRIAPHYRSALIRGATGTGKELVARALHDLSGVKGQYVVLNCSAVVETLFESELFGHVKGAFTGADRDKTGLFEYANGGTLFLDEIGDMPLSTQSKLLRALQNQEVLKVGSLTPRKVDVRVIAATHKDLQQAIRNREFREDLYYRLSMAEIRVPSLSERREDIPLLAQHFVQQFGQQYGKPVRGVTPRVQIILSRYAWPGNVRELENAIGHACMMATGELIEVEDLPEHIVSLQDASAKSSAEPEPFARAEVQQEKLGVEIDRQEQQPTRISLAERERELVLKALNEAHGNQSEAARKLGIGRDALRYKMRKYGLS